MKSPRVPLRPGFVPYAKFCAVVGKWKSRALLAENELRRRVAADKAARGGPLTSSSGGFARCVVVVELPKRDAETERNGFTTPGETGGITSKNSMDDP
jgi:hypothetical protein